MKDFSGIFMVLTGLYAEKHPVIIKKAVYNE
jgi:hypothetical protein